MCVWKCSRWTNQWLLVEANITCNYWPVVSVLPRSLSSVEKTLLRLVKWAPDRGKGVLYTVRATHTHTGTHTPSQRGEGVILLYFLKHYKKKICSNTVSELVFICNFRLIIAVCVFACACMCVSVCVCVGRRGGWYDWGVCVLSDTLPFTHKLM